MKPLRARLPPPPPPTPPPRAPRRQGAKRKGYSFTESDEVCCIGSSAAALGAAAAIAAAVAVAVAAPPAELDLAERVAVGLAELARARRRAALEAPRQLALREQPFTLVAAEPSAGSGAASPPPPPLARSTSLKRSCDARNASSRVAATAPTPRLSCLRIALIAAVAAPPPLPRPWRRLQPIPGRRGSFMPTLSFSSAHHESPCRPAEPYMARNFFASPEPMTRGFVCGCADVQRARASA